MGRNDRPKKEAIHSSAPEGGYRARSRDEPPSEKRAFIVLRCEAPQLRLL